MIEWPATLPQYVEKEGYEETTPDTRIRTPMDMGPQKVRRRYTAQVRKLSLEMVMSKAQAAAFDTFFVTTTASGSLPFEFPDPRGTGDIEVRFGEGAPNYSAFTGDRVIVSFELEVMP